MVQQLLLSLRPGPLGSLAIEQNLVDPDIEIEDLETLPAWIGTIDQEGVCYLIHRCNSCWQTEI